MFLRFLRQQGPKQKNTLQLCILVIFRVFIRKDGGGKRKVLMKLKPTNQAVGMTKKMRRKIEYEK